MRSLPLLRRLAPIALLLPAVGIPATEPWALATLILAGLLLWLGNLREIRWAIAGLVAAVLFVVVRTALPMPVIEEGHAALLIAEGDTGWRDHLPSQVHAQVEQEFAVLAANANCRPAESLCWRSAWRPTDFQLNADGFFQKPLWSRQVTDIGFTSAGDLRLAALNGTNLLRSTPGNIDRNAMPFLVVFQLPAGLEGGRLCWRGLAFWEADGFAPARFEHTQCREIGAADLGKRVYGASLPPHLPLAMELQRPAGVAAVGYVQILLSLAATAALVLGTVRPPGWRRLRYPLLGIGTVLLTAGILDPRLLDGLIAYKGGWDGIHHDSFARAILTGLHQGQGWQALLGGERVFYFMPGLRYWMALEKMFFGETHYLSVIALCVLPFFIFGIAREVVGDRWAKALVIFFVLAPLFERLGFAQFLYVKQTMDGNPDGTAYVFFYGGMLAMLWAWRDAERSALQLMATGLCLAATVALRPSLAPGIAILLSVLAWKLLEERRFGQLAVLSAAFAPVLLIPLHNWVFGGQLVPLTSSATISVNLPMPPSAWAAAAREMLALEWNGAHVAAAIQQIGAWNRPSEFYRLLTVAAVLWMLIARSAPPAVRLLAAVAAVQHLTLFFFGTASRYTYGTWALSFLVFCHVLRDHGLPAWRRWRLGRVQSAGDEPI